jgi:CRISPR-associated protein (Cas_Csm6)
MSSIILSFVGSQDPYSNNTNQEGSIVTLITHLLTINQPIKQVILLHTDTTTQNAIDTKEWLESNPANLSPDSITLKLVDPTLSADPVNLLLAAQESRNAIDLAHSQMDSQDTLEFNASSGTPVMKSVWSVLQAAGYAPHSRIWQVRNPKEMRPNQDRVFTTDVATLKDEFDRKVIAQQVQDYNYNGAAITLKESNLYRPEIAALLVYGYQRLALNFDQAFSAIDPLREQIDRCWISEITPLRQKQGKALLLEAYFNALLRLKMRQYADFLVALFRLQEQILYYLVQDVIGLEISGKAQEKERSCRLIEEVEDGKLFRFLENYKLPKGGKLDIYRGMSRYVYQGIVAYYPRFSKIIPLIEFLNSYCDLRNDFVHGFVGVSEIEDEPMLLTNLNHLMRQITQVPDQNPFDRLNQDILNSLRTS